MPVTIINTPEDLKWLKDVHGITASFAILHGSEDAPLAVEAFAQADPTVFDKPIMYRPEQDGKLTKSGE
jgi:hypothetical protein